MLLAEALLLRKQLAQKVEQLKPIKLQGEGGMFETKTTRRQISETVDEITVASSKLSMEDVTKEFDKYATALRKCDAAIQKANWAAECDFTAPDGMQ